MDPYADTSFEELRHAAYQQSPPPRTVDGFVGEGFCDALELRRMRKHQVALTLAPDGAGGCAAILHVRSTGPRQVAAPVALSELWEFANFPVQLPGAPSELAQRENFEPMIVWEEGAWFATRGWMDIGDHVFESMGDVPSSDRTDWEGSPRGAQHGAPSRGAQHGAQSRGAQGHPSSGQQCPASGPLVCDEAPEMAPELAQPRAWRLMALDFHTATALAQLPTRGVCELATAASYLDCAPLLEIAISNLAERLGSCNLPHEIRALFDMPERDSPQAPYCAPQATAPQATFARAAADSKGSGAVVAMAGAVVAMASTVAAGGGQVRIIHDGRGDDVVGGSPFLGSRRHSERHAERSRLTAEESSRFAPLPSPLAAASRPPAAPPASSALALKRRQGKKGHGRKRTAGLEATAHGHSSGSRADDEVEGGMSAEEEEELHWLETLGVNEEARCERGGAETAALSAEYRRGEVPLHVALRLGLGRPKVLALLHAAPRAASCLDYRGRSPLHLAACYGAPCAVVQALLNYRPHAAVTCDDEGHSPLDLALRRKHANPHVIAMLERHRDAVFVALEADDLQWTFGEQTETETEEDDEHELFTP
ncbi:hypothetical protein Ctob_005076 [Chrysochromulina tobinii]|uniref:Uncharacterized protein n=1 Tax=Chrysochromulina tobinii TaxID=1460289 RepID=A0A0M0JM52_9EUKA|nr:hypothetical protein Ctob_005076 [Chrysochromulina tobinii]|eukprot:KOO27555.1 hypothetical protein Ctob_005076 [Chrysochromulina sp. CCMP291]